MVRIERVDGGYMVFDEGDANTLYWGRYFGRPVNTSKPRQGDKLAPLRLSRYEALYLLEKNEIEVYRGLKKTKPTPFRGRSATTYLVYKDLRERGLIVRSGLKFGATFAVYLKGPGIDHAPFFGAGSRRRLQADGRRGNTRRQTFTWNKEKLRFRFG